MAKFRGKRRPMSRGKSKRHFSKASIPHAKNIRPMPMRGGIRL